MIKIEFEVQVKCGRRSDSFSGVKHPTKYPCFVLNHNYDWNDYNYYTWYSLYFFKSKEEKYFIGELKILHNDKNDTDKVLPRSFQKLNTNFCSLGIDSLYYQRLRNIFSSNECNHILLALQDCAIQIEHYERFKDKEGFQLSLFRDLSSERAWRAAKSIINTISFKDAYSFQYLFHPKYNPNCVLPFRLKFDITAKDYYRCACIIGENGVGKTTILSSLTDCLINQKKEFFKSTLPLFSSVMSICTTSYDSFSDVKKDKNEDSIMPYYAFCANQQKNETLQIIEQSIYNIRKRMHDGKDLFPNYEAIIRKVLPEMSNFKLWKEEIDEKNENKKDFIIHKENLFRFINSLSSGQLQLFLLITFIFRRIMYDSLIVIDEPEIHLHPKAMKDLFKLLMILLNLFQSYCIVSTHSPLIVRELPGENVYLMRRINDIPEIGKIGIETLGEDISILYNEIFGYDDETTYFTRVVKQLKSAGADYKNIINKLTINGHKLSINARFTIKRYIDYEKSE